MRNILEVPISPPDTAVVLDPLSAIFVVAPGAKDPVSPETCARTVPVFDAHQRFDLKLSFKRIEQARGETAYRGPLLVCRVDYRPIAGHNAKSWAVKYLTERTDVEVALAPIAGTHVLVPYRASFPTWYGTAVIQATQFDTTISAARGGAAADAKVQ